MVWSAVASRPSVPSSTRRDICRDAHRPDAPAHPRGPARGAFVQREGGVQPADLFVVGLGEFAQHRRGPQRFGGLFGSVFVDLLRAGQLRTVPYDDLDPRVRDDLRAAADGLGLPMRPGELQPFVAGWHFMLGIVSVEFAGHLCLAFGEDTEAFVRQQLDDLAGAGELDGREEAVGSPSICHF